MAFKRSAVRSCLSPHLKLGEEKLFNMTTLRERSHVILWLLLFFFIASMTMGGLVGGSNIISVLFGSKDIRNYVGSIDGKRISIREYDYQLRVALNNILNTQGENAQVSEDRLHRDAWESLKEDYIIKEKIKELNLTVYSEEVKDYMLQSPPQKYQEALNAAGFFTDSSGAFDLISYQNAIRNGQMPLSTKQLNIRWEDGIKNFLSNKKLTDSYNLLSSLTENEIKEEYVRNNIDLTIDYIYVNNSNIPDSSIIIPEDKLLAYYEENKKDKYLVNEKVKLDYVLYKSSISEDDTLNFNIEKDSLMSEAFILSDEANYTTFDQALDSYSKTIEDTISVSQALQGFSGIPSEMGNSRKVIRFAFDGDLNMVSTPFEMNNGIAVFRILEKDKETFKPFSEVKESIERILMRDLKAEKAKAMINEFKDADWSNIADSNDLINFESQAEGKISANYKGIGKSPELEGELSALNEPGDISGLIKTPTSFAFAKLVDKTAIDEEDYQEKYPNIKSQLLLNKRFSSGYNEWLRSRKESIEVEDWRHLIY